MTDTYISPVLQSLAERAIASKDDRESWLAARRGGITATQIRDLYMKKISPFALAAQKRAGQEAADAGEVESERDLSHVKIVAWGHRREPEIVATLQSALNMTPESRVFRAEQDARHLASPDALGINFDEQLEIAEVKTGHPDFFGHEGLVKKGYLVQIVWQMYVVGAWRCRYIFEERLEDGSGYFTPGSVFAEWIHLDQHEALLAELIDLANRTLAIIADALDNPEIDEEIDVAAVNYLHALDQEKVTTEAAKIAAAAKKAAIEAKQSAFAEVRRLAGSGDFQQESLLARVTKAADVETEEEVREVDEDRPVLVKARAAAEKARLRVQMLEDRYSTVKKVPKVKPGTLTITSPQRRKQEGDR